MRLRRILGDLCEWRVGVRMYACGPRLLQAGLPHGRWRAYVAIGAV